MANSGCARRRVLIGLLALQATALIAPGTALADSNGDALVNAAEVGDADAVARFVGIGTPVDTRDRQGRTALLAATHNNHIEVARILIDAGADVNAKDRISDSPFLYAAAEGRYEILKLTLAHGADLSSTNRYGGTALIPACHHGHIEVVYALLKTKIDLDHVNRLGWTALLEAVILGDGGDTYIEIVQALVEAGANVAIADRDGIRALEHAKRRGFNEISAVIGRKAGK